MSHGMILAAYSMMDLRCMKRLDAIVARNLTGGVTTDPRQRRAWAGQSWEMNQESVDPKVAAGGGADLNRKAIKKSVFRA